MSIITRGSVGMWAVGFVIAFVTHWIYRWRHPKCTGILPPGSSGFPFIGESLQLIKPWDSLGTPPFITERVHKYGTLFRTNIAGRNLIISTDLQVNNFIFREEGKLVEQWFLGGLDELMSTNTVAHQYWRPLLLRRIGADSLKGKLLPQFQLVAAKTFQLWSTQESTEVKAAINMAFLEIGAKLMFSCDPNKSNELSDKFANLMTAIKIRLPLNIPGTTYHKFVKDKEELASMFSGIIRSRLGLPENGQGDLLDLLLQEMRENTFLTEDYVANLVLGFTLASSETIAFVFTLALKLLSENPAAIRDLTAEHEAILGKKEDKSSPITWDEYKSMTFTLQVMKETMRMGTTLPGVLRKAKKDFVINGYTIPKGWGIVAAFVHSHYNPTLFKDPNEFNPWRWKDLDSDVLKYFNPFGGGIKQCAGAEYSKVIFAIFMHLLVTKYRWEKIGGGNIVQVPFTQFKSDLRIKITTFKMHD